MTYTKIAAKILTLMQVITNEQALEKLDETLVVQKLIPQTKYEIVDSSEQITREGVVWQLVTVSCELTLIDTESGESLAYIALGAGMDTGSLAVVKAQEMALRRARAGVLNISSTVVVTEPEIIVETPESKLITEIRALWRWPELRSADDYVAERAKKPIGEMSIPELTVVRNELVDHLRGNK